MKTAQSQTAAGQAALFCCMLSLKLFCLTLVLLAGPLALFAASFEEIAGELLAGGKLDVFRGQNVAVVSGADPVSTDFAVVFQNTIQAAGATVVLTTNKVIQKEIDRQMSGIVADAEIASIGKQSGAKIVIQLILCRIPDSPKIKIMMTAAYVETNTLAASGAAIQNLDAPYSRLAAQLPLQNEDAVSVVRKKALALVGEKTGGIHDDPVPPRSRSIMEVITGDAFWGVNGGALGLMAVPRVWGGKISLAYGRLGDGWGLKDRLYFEVSPLFMNTRFGFDMNIGYRLWHYGGTPGTWNWIPGLVTAALGFSFIPNVQGDMPTFIPYLEIRGNFIVNFSLRFAPLNPYLGIQIGLGFNRAF